MQGKHLRVGGIQWLSSNADLSRVKLLKEGGILIVQPHLTTHCPLNPSPFLMPESVAVMGRGGWKYRRRLRYQRDQLHEIPVE